MLLSAKQRRTGSPAFFETRRREVPAGPVLTPGEVNVDAVQAQTVETWIDKVDQPQSAIPCRPSKHWIVFFLSPFGQWSAEDFIMGRETIPFGAANTPRGRMSTQDDRRNVTIPTRVSYGSLVGESDGEAPYGLD